MAATRSHRGQVRRAAALAVASLCAVALGATGAATAHGAATISSFSTTATTTQAGGHPNMTTKFSIADPGSPESAKNVTFEAPRGVFGNSNAVTKCTQADYAQTRCPTNSQAGFITVRAKQGGNPNSLLGTAPVFTLESGDDGPTALFGLIVPTLNIPITIPVRVRTGGDYGLSFTVAEISQQTPLAGVELTLWGFPAEDANDPFRFVKGSPGSPAGCPGQPDPSCAGGSKSSEPTRPLISNPTTCPGTDLVTRLRVQTYQDPGATALAESSYPAITGCEDISFKPVLQASPTTVETDSAAGLDLIMKNPQFLSFAASPSHIRSATVTLPEGLTINPDAADGQSACSDEDANLDSDEPARCQDNAKIGTFDLTNPSLEGPLEGSLYFAEPKPGDQYRVLMVADGFGIHAKLTASVIPDPRTGRLTIQTQELPQVPFEEFRLHLFASDRGLVATPIHCSIYEVTARFFPWAEEQPDLGSSQIFSLSSGPNGKACPGPVREFDPRLVAGTSNPIAGAFSDFNLKLDRDDGDQFIRDLNFTMPPGFTGSLRGIEYCPEASIAAAAVVSGRAELASPSCPQSSFIGTSNVASGPGGHPFHSTGRIYLSGPLKGMPLSLAVVTPALAGPYDYGVVVVRVALSVDPLTAQVRAFSDTVPLIIGGVPLRMRSIEVNLDRDNFTLNPTNCSPMSIASQGIGDQGTVAGFSSYFNAVNCAALPFRPRMAVRQLGKRRDTKRSRNPRMRFELRTRNGDANLKSITVTLPKAFAIDQRHLGNLCSKAQLESESCAGRQPIGSVETRTPLLDQPLKGPAYAVSGFGKLPRLAFILDGQVKITPQAQSSSMNGRLKTVVPVIPDAPVGYFRLDLLGGKQGYLVNTRDLCISSPTVVVRYTAQSGKRSSQRVKTRTACGKGKKRAARRRGSTH